MTARTETTEGFDLATVQLPELKPLQKSFAVDPSEEELRDLFISLFRELLAGDTYDVNVSGAMHLGSYDLVRRAVNADGLVLLQGDRSEPAVRYLYRAWRARNRNGRGLFFLRTYLQLLFPNLCQVAQLWQAKDSPYPYDLHSVLDDTEDGGNFVPDPEKYWLTSRVEIGLDLSLTTRSITTLTNVFRSILPARLVPQFRFWLRFVVDMPEITLEKYLLMEKESQVVYPWAGYRIMQPGDAGVWNLGKDSETGYYIRLGESPVEFIFGAEKSIEVGYPWANLFVANIGDADLWNIGTDADGEGYRYHITDRMIELTLEHEKNATVDYPWSQIFLELPRDTDRNPWHLGGNDEADTYQYRITGAQVEAEFTRETHTGVDYPWSEYRVEDAGTWSLGANSDEDYAVRIGITPPEFAFGYEESFEVGYPWAKLNLPAEKDSDAWTLGANSESDYRYRVAPWLVEVNIEVSKA